MGFGVFVSFKSFEWALLDTIHVRYVSINLQIHGYKVSVIGPYWNISLLAEEETEIWLSSGWVFWWVLPCCCVFVKLADIVQSWLSRCCCRSVPPTMQQQHRVAIHRWTSAACCGPALPLLQDDQVPFTHYTQGSYRSGKTRKSQGIWVVRERSGKKNIFLEKSGKSLGKWKIGATRCQIFRLKCIKFDFLWGSTPDPAGWAYSTPPGP